MDNLKMGTHGEEASLCAEAGRSLSWTPFPTLPHGHQNTHEVERIGSVVRISLGQELAVVASILKLAWTMVIAAYTDLNDIVFGLCERTLEGSNSLAYPFHFTVQPEMNVVKALESIMSSDHKTTLITNPNFPNILAIHLHAATGTQMPKSPNPHFDTCPLVLNVVAQQQELHLYAEFKSAILSSTNVQRVVDQMAHNIHCIKLREDGRLRSLLGISPNDFKQVQAWNSRLKQCQKELCVHDLIKMRCDQMPRAQAICSWDGTLQYSELDLLSDLLAKRLIALEGSADLNHEKFVGLLFEKSLWTTVSIVAAMKAGYAFFLMDTTLPDRRLEKYCKIAKAVAILTSADQSDRASQLGPSVLISETECQGPSTEVTLPTVHPSQPLYLAFTSGSTGEPKAVVIQHAAASSGVDSYSAAVGVYSQSRVFQAAGYSFVISIEHHLSALTQGACLCVPLADEVQNNFQNSMNNFEATWIEITPSMARLLDPERLPHLKTLCLTGEAILRSDLEMWVGKVELKTVYGQSENSLAALSDTKGLLSNSVDLGQPYSAKCWIVNPRDHDQLVPIGAEGELLLEGPCLARGYLNSQEQTEAAFIYDPTWARECRPDKNIRLLKTGDIVRYRHEDGLLQYIGRSGTQVKLRGQRVELTEVEFELKRHFQSAETVVVEIVTPLQQKAHDAVLVAFIFVEGTREDSESRDSLFLPQPTNQFTAQAQMARSMLAEALPRYMVPEVFVPLARLPMTPSGKQDRRALRSEAMGSGNRLYQYRLKSAKPERQAQTGNELVIQQICASILLLEPPNINMNNTFFEIGGSSLTAIELVGQSRDAGFCFTTQAVFQQNSMAELATQRQENIVQKIDTFPTCDDSTCVLREKFKCQSLLSSISNEISDIFLCTRTQQWLLENYEGGCFMLSFSGPLDITRLQNSCDRLTKTHNTLRSLFAYIDGQMAQVILKEIDVPFSVNSEESPDPLSVARNLAAVNPKRAFRLGEPPLRFSLIKGKYDRSILMVQLSHAQYDGDCENALISDLCEFYRDSESAIIPTDFGVFARKMASMQIPEAFQFWKRLLHGSMVTTLPNSSLNDAPKDIIIRCSTEVLVQKLHGGITLATLVKAAWSNTLREVTGASDIVFAQLADMRGIDVARAHRTVGLCLNRVPVRVNFEEFKTVMDLLHGIQQQHAESIPFQTAEWDNVVSQSTNWPKGTAPGSLLIHRSSSSDTEKRIGSKLRVNLADYVPVDLALNPSELYSEPQGDALQLTLEASSRFTTQAQIGILLEKLHVTLIQFMTTPERLL